MSLPRGNIRASQRQRSRGLTPINVFRVTREPVFLAVAALFASWNGVNANGWHSPRSHSGTLSSRKRSGWRPAEKKTSMRIAFYAKPRARDICKADLRTTHAAYLSVHCLSFSPSFSFLFLHSVVHDLLVTFARAVAWIRRTLSGSFSDANRNCRFDARSSVSSANLAKNRTCILSFFELCSTSWFERRRQRKLTRSRSRVKSCILKKKKKKKYLYRSNN